MHIKYFSVFFCLLVIACAHPPAMQEADTPIILKATFSDGKLAAEQEARADSTLHGLSKYFYHSGQLKMQNQFRDGFREGRSETYHHNGKVESIHHYKQGIPDGSYQWFYPEGALRQEGGLYQ